jgi:hypothetical protein
MVLTVFSNPEIDRAIVKKHEVRNSSRYLEEPEASIINLLVVQRVSSAARLASFAGDNLRKAMDP